MNTNRNDSSRTKRWMGAARFLTLFFCFALWMTVTASASACVCSETNAKAWRVSSYMPTSAGTYYLTQDVTLYDTWTPPTGTTEICLNGHVLKMIDTSKSKRLIQLNSNATLYIYDCNKTNLSHTFKKNTNGYYTFSPDNSGNITVSGGVLTNSGGILVNKYGSLILNGGTIAGNQQTNYTEAGAGVATAGYFQMDGGKILGNYASNSSAKGAGLSVLENGTAVLNAGSIEANYSANSGGGISVAKNASCTMESGSEVKANSAFDGGGIYVTEGGIFNLNGGAISENESFNYKNGGGACVAGTFNMRGGNISSNVAQNGGGVSLNSTGTFNMSGGTISENRANMGGGVSLGWGGHFTLEGGTITNNTANYGAGVDLVTGNGSFLVKGGKVIENHDNNGQVKNVRLYTASSTKYLILTISETLAPDTRIGLHLSAYGDLPVSYAVSNGNQYLAAGDEGRIFSDDEIYETQVVPDGTGKKLVYQKIGVNQCEHSFANGTCTKCGIIGYSVIWKSGNVLLEGSISAVNSQPVYGGDNPDKATDANGEYTFSGWNADPAARTGVEASKLPSVTNNVTYYAIFAAVPHSFDNACDNTCNTCSFTRVTQHQYVERVTEATCTEQGYTTHTCSICDASFVDQYTAPKGHTWDAGTITTDPSCIKDGVKTFTCTACGVTKTQKVDALGHTIVNDNAVAPTCTATGLTEGSHCSVCNTVLTAQDVVPMLDHTTETRNEKAPTCTETGYSGDEVCTVCGKTIHTGTVIDAKGHTPEVKNDQEATCTEPGYTGDEVCSICGEQLSVGTSIEALGHSWGEWTETTPATYKAPGEETRSCTRCEETETREIPRLIPVSSFSDVPASEYYAAPVAWAVDRGITAGTAPGLFSPKQNCTRGQIVTFLWRANGSPEPTMTENPFTDVSEDSYCYKAVLWAVENGITAGSSDTTFSPNASCTRAQAVTFQWRADGRPIVSAENPFRDIKATDYHYNAVLWAVKNSITAGTSNDTFSPNDSCTRAQIVAFLYRQLG